eukprot:ctg_601.g168
MSGRHELPAPAVAGVVRWSPPHRVARATRRLYRGLYGCLETETKRPTSELPLTSRDDGENTAASDGNGVLPERDVSKDWQRTVRNVALGLAVGAVMVVARGPERGIEYVTAYLVEQSLSVDNLFVFILLFRYFRVPRIAQEKALAYGIVGAGVFRGLFVFTGVALMERFRAVTLAFGLLLLASAGRLLYASVRGEDADAERAHVDADDAQRAESLWVPLLRRRLGWQMDGHATFPGAFMYRVQRRGVRAGFGPRVSGHLPRSVGSVHIEHDGDCRVAQLVLRRRGCAEELSLPGAVARCGAGFHRRQAVCQQLGLRSEHFCVAGRGARHPARRLWAQRAAAGRARPLGVKRERVARAMASNPVVARVAVYRLPTAQEQIAPEGEQVRADDDRAGHRGQTQKDHLQRVGKLGGRPERCGVLVVYRVHVSIQPRCVQQSVSKVEEHVLHQQAEEDLRAKLPHRRQRQAVRRAQHFKQRVRHQYQRQHQKQVVRSHIPYAAPHLHAVMPGQPLGVPAAAAVTVGVLLYLPLSKVRRPIHQRVRHIRPPVGHLVDQKGEQGVQRERRHRGRQPQPALLQPAEPAHDVLERPRDATGAARRRRLRGGFAAVTSGGALPRTPSQYRLKEGERR